MILHQAPGRYEIKLREPTTAKVTDVPGDALENLWHKVFLARFTRMVGDYRSWTAVVEVFISGEKRE
jgi:hypothetical protein